jgi:internalin A
LNWELIKEYAMQKQNDSQKKPSRRKYIITTVVVLCILAGYIYKVVTWTPIDSEFKKQSEAIIRQAVAKQLTTDPNNPIDPNELTDEDFASIRSFELDKKKLSEITLLEKCTNLETLTLKSVEYPENYIPAWMEILLKLNIINSYESLCIDLKPIRKLNKLQYIDLCNLSYYDVPPRGVTQRGGVSPFKNIEPLSSLTNLTYLDLSGSYVSNIEPIKNLRNLQHLDISYDTNVTDFEPLKGLINLATLDVSETLISNIEPLKGLNNLESLSLHNNQVSDLKPLKGLTNLLRLYLSTTQVSDLEPIRGLTRLQTLYLSNTQVSDLKPLKELINLQSLRLENTPIYNLEPLRELKYLRYLHISKCSNISDEQVKELQKALPKLEIVR